MDNFDNIKKENEELKEKILLLEKENEELKDRLKKYTAPARNKKYYERFISKWGNEMTRNYLNLDI